MAKVILRAGKIGIRIVLPLMVLVIVLYLVKVMTIAQVAGPSDPAILLQEGQTFQRTGQIAQAEQRYLDIIRQHPGTSYALTAEKSLATLYLNQQDTASAMESVQRLLADFSGNEKLPHAVHYIVKESNKSGKCETIRAICQGLLDQSPQSAGALWLQMGVALSSSYLGDDEALDAAVQNLAVNFPSDRRGAEAFGQIAWSYHKQKKYQRAIELYQYVVDNRPGDDRAIFSQRGLVYVHLSLDDEDAASDAVDGLLRDFSQSPYLAECVVTIARKYLNAKKYEMAHDLYDYVINSWPNTEYVFESQVELVITDIAMGNYQNAEDKTQELLTDFAEDERLAECVVTIAKKFLNAKKYVKAHDLYDYAINSWPATQYAFRSQVGLVISDIALGNDPNAEDGTQRLLTDYAGDVRLANAARRIADGFQDAGKFQQARDVYEYAVVNWPDAENVFRTRTGLAMSSIKLGDEQSSVDAVDDLLLNHIDDKRIAKSVCQVAIHYSRRGKELYARQVYRDFLDNWSNPDLEIWARAIEINAADTAADPNAIDWLIADFSGDGRLAEVASCISERFYNKAFDFERKGSSGQAREYFQRAAESWETIVDLPWNPNKTSQACQLVADCYRRLGQHEKALAFYLHIVETWPDCKRVWHAQYLIGCSYERLKKGGVVPKKEADAIIEAAYTQLLDAYPDCPAAKAASSWLRSNAAARKGGRG